MSLTADEDDVLERLGSLAEKIEACMKLFNDQQFPRAGKEEEIRENYRNIAEVLRAEEKRTSSSREVFSAAERRWYSRTVQQATNHLRAPVNASPGPKMFSSLYEAKRDLTQTIFTMKDVATRPRRT